MPLTVPDVPAVCRAWTSAPAGGVGAHEETFGSVTLARILGAQYVVGAVLALLWTAGPSQATAPGRPVVVGLGVLAIGLGMLMALLAALRLRPHLLLCSIHACILSAQVVIATGHAATVSAASPLLLFMLWTTPYVGVFSRRARWTHGAATVVCLVGAHVVAVHRGVDAHDAAVAAVITLVTVLVVTLLVARVTDALSRQVLTDPLTGLPSRRAFALHARNALARASGGRRVAVVVLDWTGSSRSTTPTGTRRATPCSSPSPRACSPAADRATSSRDWAATSSPCSAWCPPRTRLWASPTSSAGRGRSPS